MSQAKTNFQNKNKPIKNNKKQQPFAHKIFQESKNCLPHAFYGARFFLKKR